MAGTTAWRVAWGVAAAWGTAIDLTTASAVGGHLIKIASESFPSGVPEPIKDDNVGDVLSGATYQGNFNLEGNFALPVRFDGIERFLALFLGDDAGSVIVAGAYEHLMVFQPSNVGLYGCLVMDKGIGEPYYEYETVKLTQIELGHDAGRLMATIGGIANKLTRTGALNGATEIDALDFLSVGTLGLFTQLQVRLKEVTGAETALAGGDEVLVSEAKVTLNRNISGDHVTGSSAGEVDEPETDGLPEGQLVLSFPNYKAALDAMLKAGQDLQTGRVPKTYKADLIWTGAEIGATGESYQLRVEIPAMTLGDGPTNAGGPGAKVPLEATFNILTPQTAPDGDMAWVTGTPLAPFAIIVQNALAEDALTLVTIT